MPSISFDPVADKYDATRGYPEHVARRIAEAIDHAAHGNVQTRFLEVGVGTGRIAFPLASLGRNYSGIDISQKMLDQLQKKVLAAGWQEEQQAWGSLPDEEATRALPVQRFVNPANQGAMRVLVSDMMDLPFHAHSFDAVIAVHVFHLVGDWQKAIQEVIRVMRPGGVLLLCWDRDAAAGPRDIRHEWNRIIEELGGKAEHRGASAPDKVINWLQQQGFQTERLDALTWNQSIKPRAILDGITQRLWSRTWSIPDDLFAASAERLQQWVEQQYGANIDDNYVQERHFMISRTII